LLNFLGVIQKFLNCGAVDILGRSLLVMCSCPVL
jgi:hypothetical protein